MDPSFFMDSSSTSSASLAIHPQRLTLETLESTFIDMPLENTPTSPTRKQSVFDNPLDLQKSAHPSSSNSPGGSSLTEFTKRKNWSQRIIDELKDFLHVLSPNGKIMFCAPSSVELVGYAPEELVGRNITEFIHVDDIDIFIREFQMAIHTRRELKLYYRFRKKDDKFITFEVTGHPFFTENSAMAKCFFAMAQPYPTKASSMLDSFLELKVENERLRSKLRELRASRRSEKGSSASEKSSSAIKEGQAPPSTTELIEGTAMNLSEAPAFDPPATSTDSLTYPNIGSETVDAIELFTGLHYAEGERASGISTGRPDATLTGNIRPVTGSLADLDLSRKEDPLTIVGLLSQTTGDDAKKDSKQRKKKAKLDEEEYVCTDCGTTDSPEWRKGPNGPKTLCNACGLRWAKKNKKAASGGGGGGEGEG